MYFSVDDHQVQAFELLARNGISRPEFLPERKSFADTN